MKPRQSSILAATLLAITALSWPATAQAEPIRIMPVGDSITEGAGGTAGRGGYRGPLWDLLAAGGYDIDFVGSWQGNSELLVDKDHDGHGGWTIGGIHDNIEGWLDGIGASPDIILLHIGTNDFGSGASNAGAINQLDDLVTRIAAKRPDAHIILTNLLERGGQADTNIQNQFNPYVQGIVDAHALAGDLITFLDMRSAVPLSDMPDQLHPNDTGYAKMAAAWIGAIEAVLEPADDVPPALVRARGLPTLDQVVVTFNRRLDPTTAQDTANYALDGGLNVLSAVLSTDERSVTLTTDLQTVGVFYTLTVNDVLDQVTPTPNTIAADSTIQFFGATASGYQNNVPESDCYTLVYSLDVPGNANYGGGTITYDVDNRNLVGQYDRIAYYMELQAPGQDLQYAWASMDSFTSDINTIGVPVLGTGATFQQLVGNLNVASNVPGVTTGNGQQGNIEFWPTNYDTPNSLPVPGADPAKFDFGDNPTPGNYGSMQVHNTDAAQTVLAFNSWGGNGGGIDIGIGNNPVEINNAIDWTFADNGAGYSVRKLQVLVRTSGDLTPPTLASATASFGKDRVIVVFSEPVRRETLVAGNFSLDNGVTVLGVTVGDDLHEVVLETTGQPATALTLTVSNVRDTSPNANQIAPASTIAVAPATLPAEVIANIGAAADGYELVYTLDIPNVGNFNAGNPYTVDNSAAGGGFSRVAYYLELLSGTDPVQYLWASMDPFTGNKGKLGVPTVASAALFAQKVSNLDVISNVAGIVNGTGLSTGNLEFWPSNYNGNNDAGVPGAAGSFDFGDGGVGHGAGYGSMQIHNHGASQTLFAMNNWGNDGNNLCLGIGNRPAGEPDWTFADNAGGYSRKVMHIMVLPSAPTPAPAEVVAAVDARAPGEADDYQLVYSLDLPAAGNLVGGGNFQDYFFNDSGRTDPFSRVAYYLELQKDTDPDPTFVWVSMDAFSNDRVKIGVPSVASGALWQQFAANMNVVSNGNVTEGTGLNGNLEFWPGNYGTGNSLGVPGASDGAFDFGDGDPGSSYGHGSMQVHNYGAGQTLFAINNWGNFAVNNNFGVGIGNDPAGGATTDYTFAATAASYNVTRRLHVLVLPGSSSISENGPEFTTAVPSTTLDRLVVKFDREVSDSSAVAGNFSIDGGLTVTGATLLAGNREIALATSAQTAGTLYTVAATGVRERAASGTLITPGSTVPFTAYTPPAALANVPDAGYELIYQLAIPAAQPRWNFNPITYSVDEAKYGERLFDRVAYLMELDGNWVYASFDPHTNRIAGIGVPTLGVSSTPFQQYVTNMNVASNVPSIVTGSAITTGNIEFWGANYEQPNAVGIPDANDGTYDFGDRMTSALGYGSMQVHNHGASQTLFSYNNWAANSGGFSDLGIGTNPGPGDPDWTFTGNAGNYTVRNLYVLARPGGVASGDAPEILTHPCDQEVAAGGDVTFGVTMFGSGPFTYQWRCNGTPVAGATLSWLELSGVSAADVAAYDVVVTGSNLVPVTSHAALLTLAGTPPSPIELWRIANGFHPSDGSTPGEGDTEDKESDGLVNLLEFGFGTNPNLADNLPLLIDGSRNGTPTVDVSFDAGVTYSALFTRRKDHGQPGSVEYTVQFSSNLAAFHDSADTPTFVADSTDDPAYEVVMVPYPLFDLDGQKARFFRVMVTAVP